MTIHATAVALRTASGWRAVLLRGPSGSGKSDLALRLIGRGGWRLVGDDQVQLWRSGETLFVAPAPRLAGALEARGIGLMGTSHLDLSPVALMVDCGQTPDRLPEQTFAWIEGVRVPLVGIVATEPSAPDKLRLALTGRDVLSRLEP